MNKVENKKVRYEYLDIAKAISIILVVLGHCCTPQYIPFWAKVIYSFHMPLFFMVCGVTAHQLKEYSCSSFRNFALKNFVSLMIPYFIWSLIYMPITLENIKIILYGSCEGIIATGVGCFQLWFLPCLFLTRIAMYGVLLIENKYENKSLYINILIAIISLIIGFVLPRLSMGYPWCLNIAFVSLGIVIIGHCYSNVLKCLDSKSVLWQIPFIIIGITMLYIGNKYGTKDLLFVSMCTAEYRNIFWFLFNASFGCITVRSIATLIAKIDLTSSISWIKKSLIWLGQNTIGIVVLHMPIGTTYIANFIGNIFNLDVTNLLVASLSTIIIITICILLIIPINKYVPILIGKSNKIKYKTT